MHPAFLKLAGSPACCRLLQNNLNSISKEAIEASKKINATVAQMRESGTPKVRLMFQDEAGLAGSINPNTVGLSEGSVPAFHAITYGNIGMCMEQLNP